METRIKSTLEGLTDHEVEILKDVYNLEGEVTLYDLAVSADGTENIGHLHVAEFNRQIVEGERCKGCADHESESPINVHGLCEDCGME